MTLTINIGAKKSKVKAKVVRCKKPKLDVKVDINLDDIVKVGKAVGIRLGAKH